MDLGKGKRESSRQTNTTEKREKSLTLIESLQKMVCVCVDFHSSLRSLFKSLEKVLDLAS